MTPIFNTGKFGQTLTSVLLSCSNIPGLMDGLCWGEVIGDYEYLPSSRSWNQLESPVKYRLLHLILRSRTSTSMQGKLRGFKSLSCAKSYKTASLPVNNILPFTSTLRVHNIHQVPPPLHRGCCASTTPWLLSPLCPHDLYQVSCIQHSTLHTLFCSSGIPRSTFCQAFAFEKGLWCSRELQTLVKYSTTA